ncbi:MAG: UTP--glucose-1-phosphate uridylyltransferase [Verrucomicrobiota bacterium]|nr:UTP--glucose-1-phosphate uridylyltransferase [Verrucomicrobiota bacterium]
MMSLMVPGDLEQLQKLLLAAKTVEEKIAVLDRQPNVLSLLSTPSFFRDFVQKSPPECECALKQLAAINQVTLDVTSPERWRELLGHLLNIDHFYREIGGIVGYQAEVMRLLRQSSTKGWIRYHAPLFDDISKETPEVGRAIEWGLEALPEMAEFYPLGGAADRLHLVDERSGSELPAAKLPFLGRTLLEGLIRDLQAREKLYFERFGRQITTPIVIMTSWEKENHRHVLKVLEENRWFGRPPDSFRLFVQPLVPAVDERGKWHTVGPLKLLLKPGGHGAFWKLARDEQVFEWLRSLGRKKALVRQINNPAAGLDYGLLAFCGIGWKKQMSFGFASCPRLVQSAEGMNVLAETEREEIALTNIEYCDFAKCGIEDAPLKEGEPYSRFSSNTNILFADLDAIEKTVEKCPFPGLLINLRKGSFLDEKGVLKEGLCARLESMMQNIADVLTEPKQTNLVPAKTFVTYNHRHKTISVAKKAYYIGKPLLETPEQCFYELQQAARELLLICGFTVPSPKTALDAVSNGPESLFLYHPALGPLYSLIRKKLRGGSLAPGSELLLEIADVDSSELTINGSLQIKAERILGTLEETLRYSNQVGRCVLHNVRIFNRGVDWATSAPYWKMNLRRFETVQIELLGHSEFHAVDVELKGAHHFLVEEGTRMIVRQHNGELIIQEESL